MHACNTWFVMAYGYYIKVYSLEAYFSQVSIHSIQKPQQLSFITESLASINGSLPSCFTRQCQFHSTTAPIQDSHLIVRQIQSSSSYFPMHGHHPNLNSFQYCSAISKLPTSHLALRLHPVTHKCLCGIYIYISIFLFCI